MVSSLSLWKEEVLQEGVYPRRGVIFLLKFLATPPTPTPAALPAPPLEMLALIRMLLLKHQPASSQVVLFPSCTQGPTLSSPALPCLQPGPPIPFQESALQVPALLSPNRELLWERKMGGRMKEEGKC